MTDTGGLVEPLAHNSTCGHWRGVHCRAQLWRGHGAVVFGIVWLLQLRTYYYITCHVWLLQLTMVLLEVPSTFVGLFYLTERHLLKQDASSHIIPLSTFQPSAVDLEAQAALPNFNFSRASRGEHTPMLFLSILLPSMHSRTSSW